MIPPSSRLRRAITLRSLPLVTRILGPTPSPSLLRNPDLSNATLSSLHLCALHGLPEIATLLLDLGHESEGVSRDTAGQTALMLACQAGPNDEDATTAKRIEIGRMLIERFPEYLCVRDRKGMDAFAHAAASGTNCLLHVLMEQQLHPFAVEALQDFSLNPLPPLPAPPKQDLTEEPAFSPTPHGRKQPEEPFTQPSTASAPASAHPFLSVRDTLGNTPLHHAATSGQLKTMRILVMAGADGGARNAQTWTPVDYAASVSAEVYLRQLIKEQLAARGISTGAGTGRNSPAWNSPGAAFGSPVGVRSPAAGFASPVVNFPGPGVGYGAGRQSPDVSGVVAGRMRGGSDERWGARSSDERWARGRGESDEKKRAAGQVRLVRAESSDEEEENMIGRARTRT